MSSSKTVKYALGDKIGDGGNALVYRCSDRVGNVYCCKLMPKATNARSRVQHEADVMKRLALSLRVPRLVDVVENDESYCLVQELCKGGNVTQYLASRARRFADSAVYAENTVASIVRGTLRALLQVHGAGIIHRDIKHGNVLLSDNDDDAVIKLCDFGLAAYCDFGHIESMTMQGTPAFMAPEVLSMRTSFKSDVWSLGVLTYQLLCGRMPFRSGTLQELWHGILFLEPDTETSAAWRSVSVDAKAFVRACLTKSEQDRIPLDECLAHPWLARTDCADRFKGEPLVCEPFVFTEVDMHATTICSSVKKTDASRSPQTPSHTLLSRPENP